MTESVPSSASTTLPLFLFDGECGFCRKWARRLGRISRGRVPIVPWQSVDIGVLGVSAEDCNQAVQFVAADGSHVGGAVAVGRHLRLVGLPWSVAGRVLLAPGIKHVAGAAYRWVARNRHRFRGEP